MAHRQSNRMDVDFIDYYRKIQRNFSTTKDNLASKCRICLNSGCVLITDNDNTKQLLETLQVLGDINIDEEKAWPKYLCEMCYKFLMIVIEFRNVAKQSLEILKLPVKEEIFETQELNIFNDANDNHNNDAEQWSHEQAPACEENPPKKTGMKFSQKITCKVCSKVVTKSYYRDHMTMHDPDHKKYVCDKCGKSFRLRCAYHNHNRRHTNDFSYKCQFCPYRGRYPELLKTHLRTHTGEYQFMCTECPARFLFKSNLNTHMFKHKIPQFKCDGCKRAFHSKLLLQRHYQADHVGIKNHVCNICGKAFGYRNAMMKHQRRVHKREKMLHGRMPSYLMAVHDNAEQNFD